jgi:hypothetical protein
MVYLVLLAGTVFQKEIPCGPSRLEGCLVAQVDVTSADWQNCVARGGGPDRRAHKSPAILD